MESTPGSFSKNCYDKANEAFTNDNYQKAIELYSDALSHDPCNVDYLCSRAHAYIKNDEFEKAKTDGNKAIDIALKDETERWTNSLSRAFLRSGIASFNLGRFSEAKNCFLKGQQHQDEMGIKQWITWCDEKMEKLGIKYEKEEQSVAAKEITKQVKEGLSLSMAQDIKEPQSEENGNKSVACNSSSEQLQMPIPKIKHDWYQTETQVVIEIRIKGVKPEEAKIAINTKSLSVTAKLPASSTYAKMDSDYSLELDLAHPVIPDQSNYKVLSTKIEIKLKKEVGIRWTTLEGSGEMPTVSSIPMSVLNPQQPPTYPSAKGKNWDRIAVDIDKELENDKPEGEAALNEMFQKIYKNADENTQRAMNKSFQESGGTVLSTNWSDIGKQKTDIKPPDGMEWKKWD